MLGKASQLLFGEIKYGSAQFKQAGQQQQRGVLAISALLVVAGVAAYLSEPQSSNSMRLLVASIVMGILLPLAAKQNTPEYYPNLPQPISRV